MADILELEESELFDDYVEPVSEHVSSPAKRLPEAEDSDDDHSSGLILPEFDEEEDRSGADDGSSIPAAGTSIEKSAAQAIGETRVGTSPGTTSQLGSLKTFEPVGPELRPWRSESDLGVAASLPAHHAQFSTHQATHQTAKDEDPVYLGTSMPIRIPFLHRRGLSSISDDGRQVGFVPPHLIHALSDTSVLESTSMAKLSPSAAEKRERLLARNAILRSTGFIEVQSFAAPVGEVIDTLKESVMPKVNHPRQTAQSSLTALLGTSR